MIVISIFNLPRKSNICRTLGWRNRWKWKGAVLDSYAFISENDRFAQNYYHKVVTFNRLLIIRFIAVPSVKKRRVWESETDLNKTSTRRLASCSTNLPLWQFPLRPVSPGHSSVRSNFYLNWLTAAVNLRVST